MGRYTFKKLDNFPQAAEGHYQLPHDYLSHETVVGYPDDEYPKNDGVDDALEVVNIFEKDGMRCCVLEVMALQYYGSERMRNAAALLKTESDKYLPFGPDVRVDPAKPRTKWPRFKLAGLELFILLVPAKEVYFAIDQDAAIVRGKTGLPFPSLPAFVQSPLDSNNALDLEDIIDAMDLSEEWAAENGVIVSDTPFPGIKASPKTHWERITRSKLRRLGKKYDPKIFATRYRMHNDPDPRTTGCL